MLYCCPLPHHPLSVSLPHIAYQVFTANVCMDVWTMALSIVSVLPWWGNRLAICVLHIACSQRLRRSVQNNNHKSGLSAECQDCLVVGSLQRTRGILLT